MKQISDTQPIMEEIFPDLDVYPMNVLITSLTKQNNGSPIISFLAIIEANCIMKTINSGNLLDIQLLPYTKNNPKGFGKDFFMKLKILCNTEELNYIAEITANDKERQLDFLTALLKVDTINVWFANSARKVQAVYSINFDVSDFKASISDILTMDKGSR